MSFNKEGFDIMKYKNIREEELKNKVGTDWFKNFDTTEIIGNIDFSVFPYLVEFPCCGQKPKQGTMILPLCLYS